MSNLAFKVSERNIKSNQNSLRKNGQVPGIIYGEFLETPIPVAMNNIELKRVLKNNNSGSIISIELGDKNINCVVKEVQKNNLHEVIHVDFQYIKPNEIIKLRIPIKVIGQENLESKRLTVETHNLFVDLQGNVEKIPESLEINVANMNAEEKISIKDIDISEDLSILTDPETIIAVTSSLRA